MGGWRLNNLLISSRPYSPRLGILPGLGHLAHEGQPAQAVSLILEHAGL